MKFFVRVENNQITGCTLSRAHAIKNWGVDMYCSVEAASEHHVRRECQKWGLVSPSNKKSPDTKFPKSYDWLGL